MSAMPIELSDSLWELRVPDDEPDEPCIDLDRLPNQARIFAARLARMRPLPQEYHVCGES